MSKKRRDKKRAKRQAQDAKLKEDLRKLELTEGQQAVVEKEIEKEQAEEDILDAEMDREDEQKFFDMASAINVPNVPPPPAPRKLAPKSSPTESPEPAATGGDKIPYTKRLADKASKFSPFFGNIFGGGAAAATGPSESERETRSGILKINNQLILTRKIIESNELELKELAKTDDGVKKVLEAVHSDQLAAIEKVQQAILEGKDVSIEDTKKLLENLKEVTHEINATKITLSTSYADISTHFADLIENDNIDREDRRNMIKELVKISSSTEVQEGLSAEQNLAVSELKKLSQEGINFTDVQKKDIHDMLHILTDDSVNNVKIKGTLKQLSDSMESSVLTEEELLEQLSKKDDKGKSLEDNAAAQGIKSLAHTAKSGAIDFLLGQVGLGGLGLGELGIGDIVGGAKAIPGLLGKAGGFLGKAGKFAGKAALPVGLALSAYDFYKGYNNADEISGQKDGQHASFGQKIQAGGASVLSGLSFGLLGSDKDMYKHLETGIQFLVGPEGILTKAGNFLKKIWDITPIGVLTNMFESIQDAFMGLFGEGSVLDKASNFLKKIFEITPIGYVMAHFDGIKKGINTLFGADSMIAKAANFFLDAPKLFFDGLKDFFGSPSQIIDKLAAGVQSMLDFVFGPDGLFSMKTVKAVLKAGAGAALPNFVVDKIFGTEDEGQSVKGSVSASAISGPSGIQAQAYNTGTSGFDAAVAGEQEQRKQSAQSLAAAQTRPAPTVVIQPSPGSNSPDRSAHIDDTKLAVMSAGLSGI